MLSSLYAQMIIDKDECESAAHSCDKNAQCTNTDGGYTCQCNDGYSGDGFTCQGNERYVCKNKYNILACYS